MPPCDAGYLIDYLFEIGPTMAAGMGEATISHSELSAWQHNTGISLNSWESRMLKRLSLEYLGESHKARSPDHPAPWAGASYARSSANLVAQRMKESVRGMT
jgi:hypothetical protein